MTNLLRLVPFFLRRYPTLRNTPGRQDLHSAPRGLASARVGDASNIPDLEYLKKDDLLGSIDIFFVVTCKSMYRGAILTCGVEGRRPWQRFSIFSD